MKNPHKINRGILLDLDPRVLQILFTEYLNSLSKRCSIHRALIKMSHELNELTSEILGDPDGLTVYIDAPHDDPDTFGCLDPVDRLLSLVLTHLMEQRDLQNHILDIKHMGVYGLGRGVYVII